MLYHYQVYNFMQITHFTFYDVNVDDLTHHELLTLTSQINYKSRSELENLLYEAERPGKGDVLKKETWRQDVEDRIAFQRDQRNNGQLTS